MQKLGKAHKQARNRQLKKALRMRVDPYAHLKITNTKHLFDTIRKRTSTMETKKDETKTVHMNGKAEQPQAGTAQAAAPEPVYKILPDIYNKIGVYLLTRPLREVKQLYTAFYRHGQKDPFYKHPAVTALLDYLSQCPMGEAEMLMDELERGGLQQYMPQVDEKGNPIQNAPGTEVKEGENKENPTGEQK